MKQFSAGCKVLLVVGLFAATALNSWGDALQALSNLKNAYQQNVMRLNIRAAQAQDALRKQYLARLDEIEAYLEEEGNLSELLTLRAEREQFSASGRAGIALNEFSPEALRKAAEHVTEHNSVLEAEKAGGGSALRKRNTSS